MKRKIVITGIINCKDEYLIVKRSKDDDFLPGVWEFPGGNMKDDELIYDALKREMIEEIGFIINNTNIRLVHYYDEIKKKKEKYHYIELDFLIKVENKDIGIKLSDEHDAFCWINKDSNIIDEYIKDKLNSI